MWNKHGCVLKIGRYTIHDGPGIRTTVFLKGCPLRCLWCCSPESQCLGCEKNKNGNKVFGRDMSVAELFKNVLRDEPFWRRSGGGVTLSGGEVLAQPEFAEAFLRVCKEHYIHTAIETSLFASQDVLSKIVQQTDFIFFDIKAMDPGLHKKLTSVDNKGILNNASYLLQSPKELCVRFVHVPGVNDGADELKAMGCFLSSRRSGVTLEILPYHSLGVSAYEELGRTYALQQASPPDENEKKRVREILDAYPLDIIYE